MNQKSVTFRCTAQQHERLLRALSHQQSTRTHFITQALEVFLAYAEQEHIQQLDLFDLVADVDAATPGPSFADQA
ncbi:MAG: hypothetical protein IKA23_08710 [Akkermansia sp.]|nr:hypothetical protein [Akkermansia sp.]MBR2314865.1 hypothetical protein [Akkermansia sp.]